MVATLFAPPAPQRDEFESAPGGYWSTSEQRERRGEPPDGEDELTVGSILFSLGILRLGAAGVSIWLARTPGRCPVEDPAGCQPYEIYGWLGVSEGSLMVGTGLTYLIIGAVRRGRHDRWSGGERVQLLRPWAGSRTAARPLEFGPWLLAPPSARLSEVASSGWSMPTGGGAQLRLRF